jgi:hypothetical protein
VTIVLLALGMTVQLGALAVDPHRLYIEHSLPSAFGALRPRLYFAPEHAHLPNRPREILEIWRHRSAAGEAYSPSARATQAFPIIDEVEPGPAALAKFKLLDSFRPWWASHRFIPAGERPVPIALTAGLFGALLAAGLAALFLSRRRSQ